MKEKQIHHVIIKLQCRKFRKHTHKTTHHYILDHNNEIATKKMLLHVEQMIFALEEYSSYKNFLPQNKQRYKKHNKNNFALKKFT